MNKVNKAIEYFNNGLNCSQSVVMAFKEDLNINEENLLKISSGFGGGMGRLQETCGTVTGAYMVIGMKNYKYQDEKGDSKEETYSLVRKFNEEFLKRHDSTTCRGLLKCDLMTEEGRKYFSDNDLKNKVCVKCIENSVSILQDLLS